MRIAAVGAGRMGRGIALAFAYAGHDVALVDLKVRNNWNELRAEAMAEMQASLAMLAELGAMPADAVARVMARIKPYAHGEASVLRDAEIVFEAVPETLEAKRDAFARICELAAPEAVLASTTSTILVTDLVPLVTRSETLAATFEFFNTSSSTKIGQSTRSASASASDGRESMLIGCPSRSIQITA